MENIMNVVEHAKRGDTEYFEGVDLNIIENVREGQYGNSVLQVATMYGQLSCSKVIYRRCPQLLYQKNNKGVTPLHQAAYDGRDEIIKFLLYANLDLEQPVRETADKKLLMMVNDYGYTALHSAAAMGHIQSAKILIEADPSNKLVMMVDKDLETPLHYAVKFNHVEMVKLLLGKVSNAEFHANRFGQTPLEMACGLALVGDQTAAEIRNILIKEQPAQCKRAMDTQYWTIIHYAAYNGYLPTVQEIIRVWPDCSELLDKGGCNFLHFAARFGKLNIVKYVLELKDIKNNVLNGQDINGNTPLHFATYGGDASTVLALLDDLRVNKLVNNIDGRNPLDVVSPVLLEMLRKVIFQFASKGDVDFFRAIQVDILRNSRDENGETVLSVTVAKGHLNCCEVILERCEELLHQTNKNGMNSFHIAVSNGKVDILEFLLKPRPRCRELIYKIESPCENMFPYDGILLTMTGNQQHTALHLAVEGGDLQSAKLLIAADPFFCALLLKTNFHSDTAMHIAVKGHHLEIVKLILKAQPFLQYYNNNVGSTPLLIALQETSSGDPRTVEIRNHLIEKQANQCRIATGKEQWNLLQHAAQKGDVSAIQEIIRVDRECLSFIDTEFNTVFHLAAKFNQLTVVEYIRTLGNIVYLFNAQDIDGNTPSHIAVSCGNEVIAKYLMDDVKFNNTSTNKEGKKASEMGPSVPFKCAKNGDVDFFRAIQVKILRNLKNEDGDSLLFVAVREGHLNCCEVITKICPELLYEKNSSGVNPLHMATSKGDDKMVELLLEADVTKKLLSMTDDHHKTSMHYAVSKHHLDIVKRLVQADPDIEYLDNEFVETPLLIALQEAASGDQTTAVQIRSYLIEKQSKQICKIRTGEKQWTLLQYAISKKDLSAIEEIVSSCKDCLPLVDSDGQNVLHHVVSLGHPELVNYILSIDGISDSVLNQTDKNGNTPLHLSTAKGIVNIALSLLYDSRVRKMILNKEGKNALEKIDFVYDLSRAKVEGIPGLVDIKELKDQSDFDLLVGALISTVSFTAGIAVPGGFFSDGPNRGNAVLYKKRTFEAFVIFNTIALALSLFVVFSHFCLRRLVSKKNILLQLQMASFSLFGAIFAMLLAFILGTFAVLSISLRLAITVCLICCCFFGVSAYCLSMTIGEKEKKGGRNQQSVNLSSTG